MGTFDIFGVINGVVGDDKGIFKVTNGFPGPVTNQAMAKNTHMRGLDMLHTTQEANLWY